MLLSCIYTFVYFWKYCFFYGELSMDNMVKREQRSFVPLPLASEVDRWYCNLFSCTFMLLSCYYGFINFLGEGRGWAREKDTSDEQVLWSASPFGLARKTQGGTGTQEAGFLLARALPPDPMLFELGPVHLSPSTCLLASNELESTLNKSLIQPHYIVASQQLTVMWGVL